jgi:hypothetical protein
MDGFQPQATIAGAQIGRDLRQHRRRHLGIDVADAKAQQLLAGIAELAAGFVVDVQKVPVSISFQATPMPTRSIANWVWASCALRSSSSDGAFADQGFEMLLVMLEFGFGLLAHRELGIELFLQPLRRKQDEDAGGRDEVHHRYQQELDQRRVWLEAANRSAVLARRPASRRWRPPAVPASRRGCAASARCGHRPSPRQAAIAYRSNSITGTEVSTVRITT